MDVTFIEWLREQKDRNDPIGDLARDFCQDSSRNRIKTLLGLVRRLEKLHACDGARKALNKAYGEWQRGQNDDRI